MKTPNYFWLASNHIYALILLLAGLLWCIQWHAFGLTVGVSALVVAVFLYRKQRWAYFAAAVWCFGLLRISMDDGHDFHQGYQAYVKLPYFIAIILVIVLHEKVAKPKKTENAEV